MEKWSRGGAEGREREVKERVGEGEEKTSNEAHVCGWRCGWGGGEIVHLLSSLVLLISIAQVSAQSLHPVSRATCGRNV